MVRILIIMALMVLAPLQGMASDGTKIVGNAGGSAIVSVMLSADLTEEAGEKECCHKADVADNKPTFCKPDIKAVMDAGGLAAMACSAQHGRPYLSVEASYKKAVDLRPPIS